MTDFDAPRARIAREPAALSRRLLDGLLIVAPGETEAVRVSSPGETVWALLEHRPTMSELVEDLSQIYGSSPETVRRDLEPLLERLLELGAIAVTAPAAPPPSLSCDPGVARRGPEPSDD